jgi:hypothetical protein
MPQIDKAAAQAVAVQKRLQAAQGHRDAAEAMRTARDACGQAAVAEDRAAELDEQAVAAWWAMLDATGERYQYRKVLPSWMLIARDMYM